MARPWLTVVMPVYNGEPFLHQALRSAASQDEKDFEIVAIDDGSSDRSLEILRSWESKLPLRIEARPRSGSWVKATNYGLASGKGEYACFLHQDDQWRSDRLAVLRRRIAAGPAPDFLMHATGYIDRRGQPLGDYHPPFRESAGPLPVADVVRPFLIQNVLSIPSALFRRDAALEGGGLDEGLWYSADWDLWLRLAGRGRTVYIARPLADYRLHPQTQTSVRAGDLSEFRRQHTLVFEKHFPAWKGVLPDADAVAARARFSIEVNTALAALATRQKPQWKSLAGAFAELGPSQMIRYLKDSRIVERMAARLRGRLWARKST
jgi:glycosyltransferase involved in cell wall biosynthesis